MIDSTYTEKEEKELLDYMDTNPKSIDNFNEEMNFITNIVKENVNNKKQVNFRMLESDLEKLKTKALIDGIPYQTLLNSIIHKFLNGSLKPSY